MGKERVSGDTNSRQSANDRWLTDRARITDAQQQLAATLATNKVICPLGKLSKSPRVEAE